MGWEDLSWENCHAEESDARVSAVEAVLGVRLPEDYRECMGVEFPIRPFREADTPTVIAIGDAIYPEYREDGWHAAEQFESERITSYRYVAEADRVAGYGAIRYLRDGHGRIDLMVHPEWQCGGIGGKLLERLLSDLRTANAVAGHARVLQDHVEALSFLRNRGFGERQRMYGLKIRLANIKLDQFWHLVNRLHDEGVRFTTYAQERASDVECLSKLLDLHNAVLPSWRHPETDTFEPATYEDFSRRVEREAGNQPDALFIASAGNLYVGYSGMFALGTAVRPEFRGRGIATALKAHTISYAQETQVESAITCTANPAMLAINEKLGYRRELVEIRMMKTLDRPASISCLVNNFPPQTTTISRF
jgi:GNAT superfamily N-acetyltransferase